MKIPIDSEGRPRRPATLRYDETTRAGGYEGRLRRPRWIALPLLGFSVIWYGFLFIFYRALGDHAPTIMYVVPVVHVVAGLLIVHRGLCALLNTTVCRVDERALRVVRGPVPEGWTVSVPIDDVREITADVVPNMHRDDSVVRWAIQAQTRDGRSVRLPLTPAAGPDAAYIADRLWAAVERAQGKPQGYR